MPDNILAKDTGPFTGLRCRLRAALEKHKQFLADLVFQSRAHAVRRARIDFQCRSLNNLGREKGSGADRNDLVIVAVEDERRHGSRREANSGLACYRAISFLKRGRMAHCRRCGLSVRLGRLCGDIRLFMPKRNQFTLL
jgi:hypothetical protein